MTRKSSEAQFSPPLARSSVSADERPIPDLLPYGGICAAAFCLAGAFAQLLHFFFAEHAKTLGLDLSGDALGFAATFADAAKGALLPRE